MEHRRVAVVESWLGQVSGGNHVHQHLAFQCLTLAQETKGRPQDAVPVEEAKTTGCGSLRVSSRSHGHWSLGSPSVGGGGGLAAHWHLPSHYALFSPLTGLPPVPSSLVGMTGPDLPR